MPNRNLQAIDRDLAAALSDGDLDAVRALAPELREHQLKELPELLENGSLDQINAYLGR